MSNSIVSLPKAKVARSLGTLTYQSGTKQQLRIDQDGVLLRTNIILTFTCTNGATGPVSAKPYALARLIRRLEMTANGQDTFISHDGASLVSRAVIEAGVRPYGFDATVVLTNSAVTTYTVVIPISHTLPRAVRPDDTAVDMRLLSQCILSIDWGDQTDLFNTPGSAAISAVTCAVEGIFLVNPSPADKYMVRELTLQTQDVTATNTDLGVLQDRGAFFYRSFNIMAVSDGLLVNTMLPAAGAIKLVSGSMTFFSRTGVAVLADQGAYYTLPVAERSNGVYRVEQTTDGQNTTLVNAGALLADLYLRFSVTKVGTTDQLIISRETMRQFNL